MESSVLASALADGLALETRVQELGDKCGKWTAEHGAENPDLLVDYGKAIFDLAKRNASLVDNRKIEEKQLPVENPNVKIASLEPGASDDEDDLADNASQEAATSAAKGAEEDEADGQADEPADAEAADAAEAEAEADAAEAEDDFEEAFQIIDLARVLYEKQEPSREVKEKLASIRELLGDISVEDDNAPQAIEDYTAAVELKRELYGPDSGQFSEAEFMLSIAYDSTGETTKSLEHLKESARAARAAGLASADELTRRQEDLEQEVALTEKLKGRDKQRAKAATKESISGRSAIATAVEGLVSGANDISQLTRKRKRPEGKDAAPAAAPEPETKQAKPGSNGESDKGEKDKPQQ